MPLFSWIALGNITWPLLETVMVSFSLADMRGSPSVDEDEIERLRPDAKKVPNNKELCAAPAANCHRGRCLREESAPNS
jgi:hypothetical protein